MRPRKGADFKLVGSKLVRKTEANGKITVISNELKFENGLLAVSRRADESIKSIEIDLEPFIDTGKLKIENIANSSYRNIKTRSNDNKKLTFHDSLLQVYNDSESILVDIDDPASIKEVDRLYNMDAFEDWNYIVNTGYTLNEFRTNYEATFALQGTFNEDYKEFEFKQAQVIMNYSEIDLMQLEEMR